MNKLISVIIPYYKKIDHIFNTINSVINQNINNMEIIIIYDDQDHSDLNILKKKFQYLKIIKFLINDKNYGVAYSRNIGLENANGEYCAFLDADDIWKPDKLIKQINFMEKNKINFSFTAYEKKLFQKKLIVKSKFKILDYRSLLKDCPIGLSTVILRKKIVPKNLFISTKTQEDLGAWLKITKIGINAYYLDEVLTTWISTTGSLSKNNFQKIKDLNYVLKKQEKINFFIRIFYISNIIFNSLRRKI